MIIYEWTVETLDFYPDCDDPDIIDTSAFDTLSDALRFHRETDEPSRIVLVRNVGNDVEGLTDRAWAYVVNGKMNEFFELGGGEESNIRVPLRFHRELKRNPLE